MDNILPDSAQDVVVGTISGMLTTGEWDISANTAPRAAHGFVLSSGVGTIGVGGACTSIDGPCVVWLPSGMTAVVRLDAGASGVVFSVSDAALGRVVPASSIAGPLRQAIDRPLVGMRADKATARAILHDIAQMQREAQDELPGMREAVMSRLCLVLIAFWRLGGVSVQTQASPRILVQNFMQLVELNARAHWRVADYARTMGISIDRLTSAIRRATGQSPLELVHRRLLVDAESLLERSALQVNEIADALGFRDAGYFNRFFTRRKGISPGRYRRQALTAQVVRDKSYAAWP